MTRLLSTVGLGKKNEQEVFEYDETIYAYEGQRARPSRYVAVALAELFKAEEVFLLATPQAQEAHERRLLGAFESCGYKKPKFVEIPSGAAPGDLWSIFTSVSEHVTDTTNLVVDITHGFRAQPFFMGAVLSFMHAMGEMPEEVSMVYGAFEAKDKKTGVTPIWDLSGFSELVNFAFEARIFLETGRAAGVAATANKLGRELRREWAQGGKKAAAPSLQALGSALAGYGQDYEAMRTGSLLLGPQGKRPTARRVSQGLESAIENAAEIMPPLEQILRRISREVEPLITPEGATSLEPDGRNALEALAQSYLDHGRYLECAATLREAWINRCGPSEVSMPGRREMDMEARRKAEERARGDATGERGPFAMLGDLRNDLEHAGYRNDPRNFGTIVRQLEDALAALRCFEGRSE